MDRRDVPSQSPVNTHSFFDGTPGHPNPALRSPALSHERPYGMHSLPSAFSMMGRRPTLSHSSPDFLTQDPMLGSQPSLSPSSHLHTGLGGATGTPGWPWMPPHPHITSPDYFTSHLTGGWLQGHDHDSRSRERIDDCLFTSPRPHGTLINGASSAGVFSAGSGIFYPHPTNTTPPVHSFTQHSSSWGNHNNHTPRGSFDHGDNHDTDIFSLPMRTRHPSLSHGDDCLSNKNSIGKHNELGSYAPERDHRIEKESEKLYDRSAGLEATGIPHASLYQDKTMSLQNPTAVPKSSTKSKTPPIAKPIKDMRQQEAKTKESKVDEAKSISGIHVSKSKLNMQEGVSIPTQAEITSLPPTSPESKTLPPPPKLTKTKAPPPPRLQVPKSILNEREGIIPTIPSKSPETFKKSVSLPVQKPVNSSTVKAPPPVALNNKPSLLNSNEPTKTKVDSKLSATKEALKQKLIEKPSGPQQTAPLILPDPKGLRTQAAAVKPSEPVISNWATSTTTKTSINSSSKPSAAPTPKIPSGKPLHMARFRLPYNNEDTSDEESDSSEVSSGSGSGSEEESEEEEEEGKEEEETGSGSDSESDSDGSDNEEEGGGDDDEEEADEDDDDDDDDDENSGILCSQGEEDSFNVPSHGKRKLPSTPNTGTQRKKRRPIDEDAVQVPLAQGWRRQTRLRPFAPQGTLRADVFYFAPCGKKLRTYPEVSRYLTKNGITHLGIENFSFSTKLFIGEMLECKEGTNDYEMLSAEEVERRRKEVEDKKKVKTEKVTKRAEKKVLHSEMVKKAQENKMRTKLEKQMAMEAMKAGKRARMEARKMKKLERMQAIQQAKQAKRDQLRMRQEQKRQEKENQKQQRRLEKLRKQEQIRLEKELRAHKAQEARRSKKRDVASAKYEEAMKKAKDRELKRIQAVLLKQQDKEQKRQQQMMIRALEIQRKTEERERQKEEKRMEKKLIKERKLEQKRREMILARELKKPVEDMVLRDAKELPTLPNLDECLLPGKAFADLLMVKEFVENFGEALDIDVSTELPTVQDMQLCLLNEGEEVLSPLCQSLLSQALDDPGYDGPYSVTSLGQHLHKVDLNENNLSEILRLFILCRSDGEHELADSLLSQPFQSLSAIQKSGVLAFLCNELLCSRVICGEIDNSIETMSSLRKDKWVIEGRIRKLKAIQAEKYPVVKIKKPPGRPRADAVSIETEYSKDAASVAGESNQGNDDDEEDDDDEDDDDEDDEDEGGEGGENGTDGSDESDEEEDDTEPQTQEELERRLKKLEKKHAQFRSKLFNHSHSLRALSLGQDRFKRRYWVFPRTGGVFIEGMASAEIEGQTEIAKEGEEVQGDRERVEKMDINAAIKEGGKIRKRNSSCLNESGVNTPKTEGNGATSTIVSQPSTSAMSTPQFVKIENVMNSASPIGAHFMAKIEVTPAQNVWFGLLPRMPCDESSLTLSHTPFSGNFVPSYSKKAEAVPVDSPIPVKRPPGRPPKNATPVYQTIVTGIESPLAALNNQHLLTPNISPAAPPVPRASPCTSASSTSHISTMSLSFEELKKSVLESLRREPAPIPPELQHGWWRLTEPSHIKEITKTLHCRGIREKMLQKNFQKYSDYISTSCKKTLDNDSDSDSDDETEESKKKVQHTDDTWFPAAEFAVNKSILKEVEELEEKVFAASLQVKGWKLPAKVSKTLSFNTSVNDIQSNDDNNPLLVAVSRLAALELGIERRYLKHPFRDDKLQIPSNIGTALAPGEVPTEVNDEDSPAKAQPVKTNVTSALRTWRTAVASATNAAQLSMCLNMLTNCIAWEKSIMKVFCQMCRKGDNEELLLLCDACDRGYHTYCCTPKLACIPEGDWYCMDCIVLASGGDNCCVCGGAVGKMAKCDNCPRNFHLQCLEPPLVKLPRSSWTCPNCKRRKGKNRSTTRKRDKKKEREAEAEARAEAELQMELEREEEEEEQDERDVQEPRHHVNRKQSSKDMAPCRVILAEMEKHDNAWPFLIPVNAKQFPEYYKIIRKPMDFHTMKIKLRDYQYTSRQEFVEDSRLVFRNCNEFNEDDSEVGQAGKRISIFFENRWKELMAQES